MTKNKVKIDSKDSDGKDITVYVIRPTDAVYRAAQAAASKTFSEAVKNNALLRIKLDSYMEEQGLWNDAKQKRLDEIDKRITDNLIILKGTDKDGNRVKLSQARKAAIQIRQDRIEQNRLLAERRSLDEFTVEGQAENARFDYLVYSCIVDEEGNTVFKSIDDYRENGVVPFAIEAASKLASMLYGMDENWEGNLPENKFLKKFNFIDDELRLVDDKGRRVSVDGILLDENNRFINEDGEFIDRDGNRIDEEGNPFVEEQPFLDDDGNPIILDKEEEVSEEVSEIK